jgi:hypothetical protein
MTTQATSTTCPTCGSLVADGLKHTEWHHKLESIESDTDEALKIVQGAANSNTVSHQLGDLQQRVQSLEDRADYGV